MSDELDELLDDLEGSEGRATDRPASGESGEGRASNLPSEKPGKAVEEVAVIKTPDQVSRAIAQVLEREAVSAREVTPSAPQPSRSKGKKEKAERGDGKCTAQSPWGTKCKLCGKVHPF